MLCIFTSVSRNLINKIIEILNKSYNLEIQNNNHIIWLQYLYLLENADFAISINAPQSPQTRQDRITDIPFPHLERGPVSNPNSLCTKEILGQL